MQKYFPKSEQKNSMPKTRKTGTNRGPEGPGPGRKRVEKKNVFRKVTATTMVAVETHTGQKIKLAEQVLVALYQREK